ncbi:MAG: beta-L-arabinofuranosidase domain-containing protein [Isosphaerales bacterium]
MPILLIAMMLRAVPGQVADPGTSPAAPIVIRLAMEPFGYHGVSLDEGLLRRQVDAARDDYLRIPNDDLLKGFRQRVGRPAPGSNLGGWYSSDIFHVFGQVLSGLARLYAATGDPACREKAEALLQGWAECIEPDGYFFYSRKPNAPHYIYDKMVGGLVDMVVHCKSKAAAESLVKITGWAVKNLDRTNAYAFSGSEWYTLSENLYRAYGATGDRKYRDFAAVWHYTEYWDLFARGGDLFGDRGNGRRTEVYHAYSHVNNLGGAAQAYLHSSDRRFLDTLIHAHDDLVAHQCFATGGFGPDEQLLPSAAWRRKTDYTHNSFETQCGAFAVFKLCKYLMTITGDARYGDWIERLAYNAIAATIPMSPDGLVFYYSDYSALGGAKRNHSVGWSCCTGTRPMALADLHDLVYFHGADDLYVNLFVPSTVVWDRPGGPVTLRQVTRFPETESTELIIALRRPVAFGLKLRAPAWLAGPLGISVNGEPIVAAVDAHGWAMVRREWQNGDHVLVRLPMKFDVRPLDSSAPFPAMIMRGPVAMAVRSPARNPGALLHELDLAQALVPSKGEPLTYHARSDQDLLVQPFHAFKQGEPYFLYLDPNRYSHRLARFSGDGWRESEAFRYNDRPGASVAFAFKGKGIRWIGYRFDDAGIAEIRIDDGPVVKVDQYAPQRDQPFEWVKDGLPAGSHRLTITILDRKPERSKGRFINVAGFEVIR